MGVDDRAPILLETIQLVCENALWDVVPRSVKETQQLIEQLEGYVKVLSLEVAVGVQWVSTDTAGTAEMLLGHATRALNPAPSAADPSTRVHDLASVARAMATLTILMVKERVAPLHQKSRTSLTA